MTSYTYRCDGCGKKRTTSERLHGREHDWCKYDGLWGRMEESAPVVRIDETPLQVGDRVRVALNRNMNWNGNNTTYDGVIEGEGYTPEQWRIKHSVTGKVELLHESFLTKIKVVLP